MQGDTAAVIQRGEQEFSARMDGEMAGWAPVQPAVDRRGRFVVPKLLTITGPLESGPLESGPLES
jgi:hypothetical protein